MFQTFHKYNENNTIKHQTFRFKQCRIVLLRPLKCREEKTPSPTYDYPMGDKIGKKDGPTFWAKRRGFSHSDYISAGFELLDFEPKSKDNSWSYVQIFHSVYTKERKKGWVAVGASATIDVRRCYLSLLYWGDQGQGLEAINHVVPLNNNKEAWLSKSATYGLDILNESLGPPPFSLLTYHADHHLYALHLLWLVVGGS